MATSGSVDFNATRDEIILKAFQKTGLIATGATATSAQNTEGSFWLNGIVKSWSASLGIPLWAVRYGAIFPQSLTTPHSLSLGPSGGHASREILHTTLSADSASSDTTIDVNSITSFTDLDNIGVELDNGDIHWTTISGAPAAGVITLASGVSSAATTGNHVWAYTAKIERPMRIVEAWTRDYTDEANLIDIPIQIVTPGEYNMLTNKATEQYPLYLAYEALHTNGVARYWPGFIDGSKIIYFRYHRILEDFDATGDNPDFPQEWILPLTLELAAQLAWQYGVDKDKLRMLRKEADTWYVRVSQNDYEEGSIQFVPSSMVRDGMRY